MGGMSRPRFTSRNSSRLVVPLSTISRLRPQMWYATVLSLLHRQKGMLLVLEALSTLGTMVGIFNLQNGRSVVTPAR